VNDKKFHYLHERQLRNYLIRNFSEVFGEIEYLMHETMLNGCEPDIIGNNNGTVCIIEIKNIATSDIFPQLKQYNNLNKSNAGSHFKYREKYKDKFKVILVAPIVDNETMMFCKENDIEVKILDNVVYCGQNFDYINKTKVFDEYMRIKLNMTSEEINQLACLLNSGTMMF